MCERQVLRQSLSFASCIKNTFLKIALALEYQVSCKTEPWIASDIARLDRLLYQASCPEYLSIFF